MESVGGAGRETADCERVAAGCHRGAGAGGETDRTVLHFPHGGCADLRPLQGDAVLVSVGHRQVRGCGAEVGAEDEVVHITAVVARSRLEGFEADAVAAARVAA